MKRLFIAAVLCAIPPLVRGAQPIADAASFDLVRRGEPACTIVIAENPSPAARLAALEIQCHLLRISGAEIPIRSHEAKVEGRRILVGESAATLSSPGWHRLEKGGLGTPRHRRPHAGTRTTDP